MMHYRKGDNVEQEITKEQLPFDDCKLNEAQKDFLWMHVKGGTKVSNVISYARNALDKGECRAVVWSGCEGGVVKTISCAEILKRHYSLYQVTRTCYKTIKEHWLPQMEGLEEIIASRKIPCIHILMSLDAIADGVNSLQKPHTKTEFWASADSGNASDAKHQNRRDNNNVRRKPLDSHGKPHKTADKNATVPQQQPQEQEHKERRPKSHKRPTNKTPQAACSSKEAANGDNAAKLS